jgi:Zn-dependent M28 family amino/carboxypeptidase
LTKKCFLNILLGSLLLTANAQGINCNPLLPRHTIAAAPLWADLTFLASDELQGRKTGSVGSLKAQRYLQQAFSNIGIKPFGDSHLHPFTHQQPIKDVLGTNVMGWLPGSNYPKQYIVITAHYDHIGKEPRKIFNGADDNASGVAALLALARNIKNRPLKHSVIFVATDAEELGLYGSIAFLRNSPVAIDKIKYNLNMDMIAYPGKKKRLYLAGAKAYQPLAEVINKSVVQASLCLLSGHNGSGNSYDRRYRIDWRKASDHYPFAKKGIPYLFFSVNDHKYYHTENDTIDKIDPVFYTAAVETIYTTLQLLDDN